MTEDEDAFLHRYDELGKTTLIAYAERTCMVRRPGRGIFTLSLKKWLELSEVPVEEYMFSSQKK